MKFPQRPEVESQCIEKIVDAVKDIPAVLNKYGFDGIRILSNALLFIAARYAVQQKCREYARHVDWSEVAEEVLQDFESSLEEQFAYYYGLEKTDDES